MSDIGQKSSDMSGKKTFFHIHCIGGGKRVSEFVFMLVLILSIFYVEIDIEKKLPVFGHDIRTRT